MNSISHRKRKGLEVHETHITTHYEPMQIVQHFNSYEYCLAKLIDCQWNPDLCPREWAIVSDHQTRIRDELWKFALVHAQDYVEEAIDRIYPARHDLDRLKHAIQWYAEQLLCERWYVPPTFTSVFRCSDCGSVPAKPEAEDCPWCDVVAARQDVTKNPNADCMARSLTG